MINMANMINIQIFKKIMKQNMTYYDWYNNINICKLVIKI